MPFKEKEKYNAYMREYHKKQAVEQKLRNARLAEISKITEEYARKVEA